MLGATHSLHSHIQFGIKSCKYKTPPISYYARVWTFETTMFPKKFKIAPVVKV